MCQGNAPADARCERDIEMDTTVIIAISIIALGFIILIGLAVWLALDRQRRNQQTLAAQPPQQSGPQPDRQPPATSTPGAPSRPPEARPAPASKSAPAEQKAPSPPPDSIHSGEYPAAGLYDQTILPPPPKRRTRKTE